jgi:hypothetical protein
MRSLQLVSNQLAANIRIQLHVTALLCIAKGHSRCLLQLVLPLPAGLPLCTLHVTLNNSWYTCPVLHTLNCCVPLDGDQLRPLPASVQFQPVSYWLGRASTSKCGQSLLVIHVRVRAAHKNVMLQRKPNP